MIKNIILDFGDIFINLDKTATPKALKSLGLTKITPELTELFKAYEKGNRSTESFLTEAETVFPNANREQLLSAWNAILLDFPDRRLEFLEQLAAEKKYRLFLLSNTNEIHIDFVKAQMGIDKFNRFKNCFEVFYLSYEMGMRKPDHEIFEFVLSQHQLVAEETFFVDDTKENTNAANELGIMVWNLLVGQEDIVELKTHPALNV